MSVPLETVFRQELATIVDAIEAQALDLCEGREADLDEVRRRIHTLKGNAFAMGYTAMGELSHAVEDAFEGLSDPAAVDRAGLGDALLDTLGVVQQMMDDPGTAAPADLPARFAAALSSDAAGAAGSDAATEAETTPARRNERDGFTLTVEAERLGDAFRRLEGVHAGLGGMLDATANATLGDLSRTLLDLQRVSPAPLTRRLRRAAREAARQTGKSVDFEVVGAEDRLDASLAHDLSEALPHVVRNAIDHGLEDDAMREARGKPLPGRVEVRFRPGAGLLRIEVSDDGSGMDPDRIARVAVRRGVIAEADVARLTRAERLRLVFRPGFSTAESVSEVSGRGIGMDVVARMVRRRGGSIDIRSEPHRGSTFVLRLPVEFRWEEFLLVERGDWVLGVPVPVIERVGEEPDAADVPALDLRDFPRHMEAGAGPTVRIRTGERDGCIHADRLRGATAAVVRGAPAGTVPDYVAGLAMVDGVPVWVLDPAGLERAWERLTVEAG